MKKIIFYLAVIVVFNLSLSSCATLLRKPSNKNIETKILISSNPSNAGVYIDDEKIDETPFTYVHKGRKSKTIKIKKEGYLTEQTHIERKLNAGWTSCSVIGGIFPGFGVPTLIDYSNGVIFDIKTDSIHIDLMSIEGFKSTPNKTIDKQENSSKVELNNVGNETISLPALEILTGGYKLIILPKTRVRFYLKNGNKYGGLITAVHEDHFEIKDKENIYFSSLKKVRFFPLRLWYPICTSYTVVSPIIWFFVGRVAEYNSVKCKWDIKSVRIIDGLREFKYGRAKCD